MDLLIVLLSIVALVVAVAVAFVVIRAKQRSGAVFATPDASDRSGTDS
jgi:hypothetical protein